jgi:glycyl-tRNA synthetase
MAEPKTNELMERIVSLCKRRGFIYQSSEIYGGINGFWDYGPLGAELKRNVKDLWWRSMTQQRDDVVGLDATIIMHPAIWKASGHVDTFSDPMVDCKICGKRFRADQVDPQSGIAVHYPGASDESELEKALLAYPESARVTVKAELIRMARPLLTLTAPSSQDRSKLTDEFTQAMARFKDEFELQNCAPLGELLTAYIDGALYRRLDEPISIVVPDANNKPHADKIAREFYRRRGLKTPELLNATATPVKDATTYCGECGGELTAPRPFNLMFDTTVGPIRSQESTAYLRPETAQAIFVQFKNVVDSSRVKVPFGIAQVGKAFRNEVTPRNFTFRSREFEQMELEFFIRPDEVVSALAGRVASLQDADLNLSIPQRHWGWEVWHKYWVEQRIQWYENIGLPRASLEEYWQKKEELAHYARATVDILFKFPFGTQELEGIAARGNFDLTQHQAHSGKSMEYFDEEAKQKYVPHVIEPSAGVDRLVLALICQAYSEDEAPDDKGKLEKRVVLRFHPRIAPTKVGVFPLLKNRPELVETARAVRDLLRPHMSVFYDDTGAIGRRYRRQDEAGTPFCVTIDFDTLGERPELRDTVTLRDRDTMKQERVRIDELLARILPRLR